MSRRYGIFSWWWTHCCPKHVEKSNKHNRKICPPSWFYLQKTIQGCTVNKTKFLLSDLDGGEWSVSCSGCLKPGEREPSTRCTVGCVSPAALRHDSPISQSVATVLIHPNLYLLVYQSYRPLTSCGVVWQRTKIQWRLPKERRMKLKYSNGTYPAVFRVLSLRYSYHQHKMVLSLRYSYHQHKRVLSLRYRYHQHKMVLSLRYSYHQHKGLLVFLGAFATLR